jgi:glyoxylase-like metal-dependent hydrolase (beta-lactamase superfamily II)
MTVPENAVRHTTVVVTPFAQNCSVVWCEQTGRAAVIDPGGDLDRIARVIERERVRVERVLLTHGHLDHVGAAGTLAERYQVPIEGPHRADAYWLDALRDQAAMFGLPAAAPCVPDRWLDDGDTVAFGNERLAVLHCPGHTPGHVVFHHAGAQLAFVGDVLFAGSIGRTDFPGGDFGQLMQSIRDKLFPLGDAVRFVPGHGPESTFGTERETNPFIAGRYG